MENANGLAGPAWIGLETQQIRTGTDTAVRARRRAVLDLPNRRTQSVIPD
jgi:hypothetical protein